MQYNLFLIVSEIHIVEDHITDQLRICLLMLSRILPSPYARTLLTLCNRTVIRDLRIHQLHTAFIRLGLLI